MRVDGWYGRNRERKGTKRTEKKPMVNDIKVDGNYEKTEKVALNK